MLAIYELLFFLVTSVAMGSDKGKKQIVKKPVIFKPVYVVALVAWVCFILWLSYLYN
jgi:hypothetical protein